MSGARQIPRPDAIAWTDSNASDAEGRAAVGRARWWRRRRHRAGDAQALEGGGNVRRATAGVPALPGGGEASRGPRGAAFRDGPWSLARRRRGGPADDDSARCRSGTAPCGERRPRASWLAPTTMRIAAIATAAAATANAFSRVRVRWLMATADRAAGRVGGAGVRAGIPELAAACSLGGRPTRRSRRRRVGVGRASIRARRASSSRSIVNRARRWSAGGSAR